jgi:hypothetical protein
VVALKKENELLREEVCQDHFEMNAFLAESMDMMRKLLCKREIAFESTHQKQNYGQMKLNTRIDHCATLFQKQLKFEADFKKGINKLKGRIKAVEHDWSAEKEAVDQLMNFDAYLSSKRIHGQPR